MSQTGTAWAGDGAQKVTILHGYYSATEYQVKEEQADAIIKTAAYHREFFALSLIWFSPSVHAAVLPSLSTPFQRTSNAGLGQLDQLPAELLHDIIYRLDVRSLLKFRQTNLRSRQTVDSIKKYQVVLSHGLNLFCALLRTRLAANISLLDFYDTLCTKACSICGEFGGFMSLLTWRRCCFKCLRQAPEIKVGTLVSARTRFRMTEAELVQIKSFKNLPGFYSLNGKAYNRLITVVPIHQASLICRKPLSTKTSSFTINRDRPNNLNFMGSCALPYYDKTTGSVEHGVSCAGCQLALEKGIFDNKCEQWGVDARDKVYARDGFLEHFRRCEHAQMLWRSSDEGRKTPPELPVEAQCGGRFNWRE
uniref:F-box domain-containing protein n=1 Tax=Gibberella zeae TaxID=5518 RepID=A0A4E9DXV0_GIBZA